jgi:hypothetical protein
VLTEIKEYAETAKQLSNQQLHTACKIKKGVSHSEISKMLNGGQMYTVVVCV